MSISVPPRCTDLEETKAFYAEILDFEVADGPENTCTAQKASASTILTSEDLWGGPPHCTGTIYLFLSDVDAYYDSIRHKAIVRWPLEDMAYGLREFGVKDCNGYTLAFAKRNLALVRADAMSAPLALTGAQTGRALLAGALDDLDLRP